MNAQTKQQIIEAIAAGDLKRLRELRDQIKDLAWMEKYIGPDGKGSIPVEAWIKEERG